MYYECNYYFSILLLHLLLSIDNYYLLYITYISCERVGENILKNKVNRTTEAQLKTLSFLPYQIQSGKTVKNVQFDPDKVQKI